MAKKKSTHKTGALRDLWSRLGWHGWQLDAPGNWNPVMLQGTARRGSLVLADLETARLELTWVAWPECKPPSLDRSIKKQLAGMADAAVRPADHWPFKATFSDAQELISEAPEEVRLVLNSSPSRRVAVIRFSPYGLEDREAVMYRVIDGFADASDQPMVPWAIYDFEFAVPQGFDLSASKLQTGSAHLSFTGPGSELLRFARIASAGRLSDDCGPVDLMTQAEKRTRHGYTWTADRPVTHLDHEVTIRRGARPGWSRLRRRSEQSLDTATWHCPECDRVFEIMRRAPTSDQQLLHELLCEVICHR